MNFRLVLLQEMLLRTTVLVAFATFVDDEECHVTKVSSASVGLNGS